MRPFNAGKCGRAFAQMLQLSERAANEDSDGAVAKELRTLALDALESANHTVFFLELTETRDNLDRLEQKLGNPNLVNKELHLGLEHAARLMQSELEKRHAFAIEKAKEPYFRDESYGNAIPILEGLRPKPRPLFTRRAQESFPNANMDIAEAGRCLALNRNNAAVYHFMQVAEIGLRALAWDRRVTIQRGKSRTIVPLDYAQWGEIIGELEKKKAIINSWNRSKAIREEAIQYYTSLIFEVSSFNEIYRKHISHARGKLYESDTAISCWGHVYRFMDKLSERMSETERTPTVWMAKNLAAFSGDGKATPV
jgi:hypothetical protein